MEARTIADAHVLAAIDVGEAGMTDRATALLRRALVEIVAVVAPLSGSAVA